MNAKKLFLSSNFGVYPKSFLRSYGSDVTIFLSTLIEADNFFNTEWFFQKVEDIEVLTCMSRHIQSKCISKLVKLGVISFKLVGRERFRYFTIHSDKLAQILDDCEAKPDCLNFESSKFKNFKGPSLKNLRTRPKKISPPIYKEYKDKEYNKKTSFDVSTFDSYFSNHSDDLTVLSAWHSWLEHNFDKNSIITRFTAKLQIKFLESVSSSDVVTIINNSIINNWQGLWPLNHSKAAKVNSDTQSNLHFDNSVPESDYGTLTSQYIDDCLSKGLNPF